MGELWVSIWWPWLPWGACGLHVGCMWRVCSGCRGRGMAMSAVVRCVVKCELWMSHGLHGAEGWLWVSMWATWWCMEAMGELKRAGDRPRWAHRGSIELAQGELSEAGKRVPISFIPILEIR
uniref:Secreted protein n=1 Tax=Vitis vinifera TaxID=29760 RepID=A5C8V7_VITVI|nr:hypothetical protein VITISV_024927 [Vitis vinifera]